LDGRVLAAGGGGFPTAYLSSAEVYDPATGKWTATASMSVARTSHTGTLLPSGNVLVVGGTSAGQPSLASAEIYDPAAGTWSPTASMSTIRQTHTATLLAADAPIPGVLVAGGSSEFNVFSNAELFVGEGGPCAGDPGFTLAVPSEAPIGEFIDICATAPGGDLVVLLGSGGQGPTVTPFGTFCLDFPPPLIFTFVMPGSGNRCFHRSIACVPDLVGVTGYLQFIALTPAGGVDGLSNQSTVTVVDHGACG
jgi:hypothetical protein